MAYNISKISKEFIGLFSSDNVGQIISNITEYALQSTDKSKLKSLKKDLEKFIDSNKYQRNPIKDDEGDIIDWEYNGLSNIDTRELNKKVVYVDSLIAILDENKKVNIKRTSKKTLPKIDASNNVPSVSSVNEVESSNILPKSTKEVKSISTLKQIHNKTSWSQTPNNLYSGFGGGGGNGPRGPENPDPPNDPLLIAILALTSEVKSLSTSVSKINKESSSAQRRTRDQIQEEKLRKIAIEEQREKRLSNESESRLRKVDKDRELEEKKLALKAQELSIKEGQKEHNKKLETIRLMESSEKTKRAVIENEKHKRETNKEKYTTKRYYDFLTTPEGQKLERSKIRAQKEMRKMDIGFKNQELEFKKAHLDYRKFIDRERKLEREKLRIDRLKEKQRKEQEKLQKQEEAKRNKRRDAIVGAFGKEDASFGAIARGAFWLHDRIKGKGTETKPEESGSGIGALVARYVGPTIARLAAPVLGAVGAGGAALYGLSNMFSSDSANANASKIKNTPQDFSKFNKGNVDPTNTLSMFGLNKPKSAADFIAQKEGVRLNAYKDAGKESIGYGHQITEDEKKQGFIKIGEDKVPISKNIFDTQLSKEQAKKLLEQDIPKYQAIAKSGIGEEAWNKLNDNQKTALTSYAYNKGNTVGLNNMGLSDAILKGDMNKASEIIKNGATTSMGVPNSGLIKRRQEEANLFSTPQDTKSIRKIAGEQVDLDKGLSKKQLMAIDVSKSMGNTYDSDVMASYNKLKNAQSNLDSTKSEKDKAPMPVNVINQSQGAPVNNTTIINNAPDTDPTIKKISYFNMYPNRVV